MKLLKSKLLFGVICLFLAAAIAFLLLPRLIAAQTETAQIVKPTQEISAGTVITEEMVATAEVGIFGLPANVVRDREAVVGMIAAEPIRAGEYFWEKDLLTAEEYRAVKETRTLGLTDGLCLVTIQFPSPSSGAAGVLRSGSLVDVYEYIAETQEQPATTEKALEDIYIFDILNSSLCSLDALDSMGEDAGDRDYSPAYMIVRCTEEEAQTLIRLEKAGTLHLTLQRTEG